METITEINKETSTGVESVKTYTLTKQMLCEQVQEESQVIMHCTITLNKFSKIRIWRTTYLYDKGSSHTSQLVHAQGINIYPEGWLPVSKNSPIVHFTLIFSGLPKDCRRFDMHELTQGDPGMFSSKTIERNSTDVYHVNIYADNVKSLE